MQSPRYNELPIKEKLTLYYYQLAYIQHMSICFFDPGPDFFNLFDKFEMEFESNQIHESNLLLFFYTIKIQILWYKKDFEKAKTLEAVS